MFQRLAVPVMCLGEPATFDSILQAVRLHLAQA
jgi:hypothetical protein